METNNIERHFARIGARVEIVAPRRFRAGFGIDIVHDSRGEIFSLEVPENERPGLEVSPLEVRKDLRHLLLLVRRVNQDGEREKDKYLCGHDERHWFVAGVENGATNVQTAMEALRPDGVTPTVNRFVRAKDRFRRKNEVFVRQGEWFFFPQPDVEAPRSLILRNEPLSRGLGSKPHWCEEVYRFGGEAVYVCTRYPRGVTYKEYCEILEKEAKASNWQWRSMLRDARVYARGRISHPDHKTIVLPVWHEVHMNEEHNVGVVFLD